MIRKTLKTKVNTAKKMTYNIPEMMRSKAIRVEVKSKPKKMIQKEEREGPLSNGKAITRTLEKHVPLCLLLFKRKKLAV